MWLGPVLVGELEQLDEFEYRFAFAPSYASMSGRPVLGQFFEDLLPRSVVDVGHPALWFCHLLPPRGPLRRLIASRAGVDADDDFGLLDWLGADLPGAVVLKEGVSRIGVLPAHRSAASRRSELRATDPLRFSLAGAQWKMSVREDDRGLTAAVKGAGGHWIAKFHDPAFPDLPRIEAATSEWARRVGIEVPAFRLGRVEEIEDLPSEFPTGDGSVFLIERFDRTHHEARIHIEDFAQVLNQAEQYEKSYEHLAAAVAAICPADLRAFVERLAFCIVAGNTDAHLKNWSLIYPDGRHPKLSPAYDLVASILYAPERTGDMLALPLNHSTAFEDITAESFDLLARVAAVDERGVREWARTTAERTREVLAEGGRDLGFSDPELRRLAEHQRRIQL